MANHILLILISFIAITNAKAQEIDSLKLALKNCKHDTLKGQIYNDLGMNYYLFAPDSAYYYWGKSLELANKNLKNVKPNEKTAFLINKAEALGSLGYLDDGNGDVELATKRYKESADIFVELNEMTSAATIYNNTGIIYMNDARLSEAFELFDLAEKYFTEGEHFEGKAMAIQNKALIYKNNGNMKSAIELYHKSLQIRDSIGDSLGLGHAYYELGIIHNIQQDFKKSKEYLLKSLQIRKNIKDLGGVGASLNELGMLYLEANNDSCLDFFRESIKYRLLAKSINGLGFSYSSIGSYYLKKNQLDSAIANFKIGLNYRLETNEKKGISLSYYLLANVFNIKGEYKKAIENATKSYLLGKENNYTETIYKAANLLSTLHKSAGNYQQALVYFEEYKAASDSMVNSETKRKTIESQMNFDFDKKEAIAKAEQERKDAIVAEEKRVQKLITVVVSIGLLLVLLLATFIYRGYRQKQKANIIITHQKEEVEQSKRIIEEKHKEITDSINYAERIQRSFLATNDILDKNLKDYFVFFRPKEAVSGDFYWASELKDGNFAFSVADSTGHGVPGAIMSILNISSLEKSIENESDPNKILDKTRRIIIERLKNDGSKDGGKDGMDCCLLVINKEHTQISMAAANNPVFIVRENDLIEFKADKMPVGKHEKDTELFTLHTSLLQKGDVIYILTDGFSDQFGGEKGKKYMIKNLKSLFLQIAHLPMLEQNEMIAAEFDRWKGENEQIDDVCIMGVRV